MASSSAPVHPARYLSVFLLLLVGVYLLVFLTGDKRAAPKLGIDLQGGTRVTLIEDVANPVLNLLVGPLGHLAVRLRNRETLRRLKARAEG